MGHVVAMLILGISVSGGAPEGEPVDGFLGASEVTVTESDDGTDKVTFDVTNISDAPLTVDVSMAGCELGVPDGATVAAASTSEVTVPMGSCTVETSSKLTVTIGGTTAVLSVKPAEEAGDTQWWVLIAFPASLVLSVLVLRGMLDVRAGFEVPGGGDVPDVLEGVPASWDFKESFVTNATVIGTVLTGLFATAGPIEAVFGEDEPNLALAIVGAAVAVALAAASPIVVSVARRNGDVTKWGLIFGGALATSAASGELFAVAYTGRHVGEAGWWTASVWTALAFAVWLLVAYAVATVRQVIRDALAPAGPEPVDPAVVAAVLVAAAQEVPRGDVEAVIVLLEQVKAALTGGYPEVGAAPTAAGDDAGIATPPSVAPSPRRRKVSIGF